MTAYASAACALPRTFGTTERPPRGLLLVFRRDRELWHKKASVFPTAADIRASKPARHAVPGFLYMVSTV